MSDNVRVYEIAEEAGATSAEVIAKAKDLKIDLKSPQSAVSFEDAEEIANYIMTGKSEKLPKKAEKPAIKKVVKKIEEVKEEAKPEIVQELVEEKEVKKELPTTKRVEAKKPSSIAIEKTAIQSDVAQVESEPAPVDNESDEESDDKNTNNRIVPKRRGLKIVKKKQPVKAEEPKIKEPEFNSFDNSSSKKKMKSLSEILGNVSSEDDNKDEVAKAKIRKEKKKTLAKAHEHGKVIEVERATESEYSDSLLGEEVFLLDMDVSDAPKILEEEKKQKVIRTTKPSAFGNRPQGLKEGKERKEFQELKK